MNLLCISLSAYVPCLPAGRVKASRIACLSALFVEQDIFPKGAMEPEATAAKEPDDIEAMILRLVKFLFFIIVSLYILKLRFKCSPNLFDHYINFQLHLKKFR